MSWFRHRPRVKTNKLYPYTTSPAAEKYMETIKEEVRKVDKKTEDKKPAKD
jgi:hypothetical protein